MKSVAFIGNLKVVILFVRWMKFCIFVQWLFTSFTNTRITIDIKAIASEEKILLDTSILRDFASCETLVNKNKKFSRQGNQSSNDFCFAVSFGAHKFRDSDVSSCYLGAADSIVKLRWYMSRGQGTCVRIILYRFVVVTLKASVDYQPWHTQKHTFFDHFG